MQIFSLLRYEVVGVRASKLCCILQKCICVRLQVTHNQLNVLDLSWLEDGAEFPHEELEPLSRNMAASLQQLIDQRDKASEVLRLKPETTATLALLLQ